MANTFTIKLVARNEGLEYRDGQNVYRFNVSNSGKEWIVFLPCSKGVIPQAHQLSSEEEKTLFPRIEAYLKKIRYLIFFGRSYSVRFEKEPPVSPQIAAARQRASQHWKEEQASSQEDKVI